MAMQAIVVVERLIQLDIFGCWRRSCAATPPAELMATREFSDIVRYTFTLAFEGKGLTGRGSLLTALKP